MKKVLLVAPVMSRSGYGEMGRFALRSMMSNPDIDLYLHNINWGKTGWIWKDDNERRMIDSLLQKTMIYRQNNGSFDASVQCTIPNEWQRLSPHDVGYTAGIETDKVAPQWLQKGNDMQKIIVISEHSKNTYAQAHYPATNTETGEQIAEYRCTTPIDVVGFPRKEIEPTSVDMNLRHDFNFLCVAQLGPRKNVDAVIGNFIEEFQNEEVGLLLKLNGANDSVMDYHNVVTMFDGIKKTLKEEGHKCSINLIHGSLTDEQVHGLYTHPKVKAMVSFTHGEGFGLPLYEAAYSGLPVVATNWSGHLDFLTTDKKVPVNNTTSSKKGKISKINKVSHFAAVKYELVDIPREAVWDGVLNAGTKWAKIDDTDARKKMRDVYKNHSKWSKKAKKHAKTFDNATTLYAAFNEALALSSPEEDIVVI